MNSFKIQIIILMITWAPNVSSKYNQFKPHHWSTIISFSYMICIRKTFPIKHMMLMKFLEPWKKRLFLVSLIFSHFVQIITTPILLFFSSRHMVRMMCNFGHSHHTKKIGLVNQVLLLQKNTPRSKHNLHSIIS